MEHIKNIEIKNFKSIRHAEIKDCRRVNVFIGYPNVGKSNILEALSLFSIKTFEMPFSSLVRLDGNATLFFNGNIDKNFEIAINNKHKYIGEYFKESIRIRYEVIVDSKKSFDNLDDNALGEAREIVLSFEIKDQKITNFRGETVIPKEFRLSLVKKYEFEKNVSYHEGSFRELIAPFGNNIFDILSANESLRKDISELFKSYDLKFSFDKSTRTFKILKNVGDDIFLISYSMIADTLRRLIFFKTTILSNEDTVLLFEEPEAHMFPPYMRKFTADVIFDKTNQFFIATHSPYVLGEFIEEIKDDLSVYVVDYDKGETVIKRLTDDEVTEVSQYGIDLFFNLESYLDKYGQPRSA